MRGSEDRAGADAIVRVRVRACVVGIDACQPGVAAVAVVVVVVVAAAPGETLTKKKAPLDSLFPIEKTLEVQRRRICAACFASKVFINPPLILPSSATIVPHTLC